MVNSEENKIIMNDAYNCLVWDIHEICKLMSVAWTENIKNILRVCPVNHTYIHSYYNLLTIKRWERINT